MNTFNRARPAFATRWNFARSALCTSSRSHPRMVRITLGGTDLAGFTSPGFDDHVRVFFPDPASGELVWVAVAR